MAPNEPVQDSGAKTEQLSPAQRQLRIETKEFFDAQVAAIAAIDKNVPTAPPDKDQPLQRLQFTGQLKELQKGIAALSESVEKLKSSPNVSAEMKRSLEAYGSEVAKLSELVKGDSSTFDSKKLKEITKLSGELVTGMTELALAAHKEGSIDKAYLAQLADKIEKLENKELKKSAAQKNPETYKTLGKAAGLATIPIAGPFIGGIYLAAKERERITGGIKKGVDKINPFGKKNESPEEREQREAREAAEKERKKQKEKEAAAAREAQKQRDKEAAAAREAEKQKEREAAAAAAREANKQREREAAAAREANKQKEREAAAAREANKQKEREAAAAREANKQKEQEAAAAAAREANKQKEQEAAAAREANQQKEREAAAAREANKQREREAAAAREANKQREREAAAAREANQQKEREAAAAAAREANKQREREAAAAREANKQKEQEVAAAREANEQKERTARVPQERNQRENERTATRSIDTALSNANAKAAEPATTPEQRYQGAWANMVVGRYKIEEAQKVAVATFAVGRAISEGRNAVSADDVVFAQRTLASLEGPHKLDTLARKGLELAEKRINLSSEDDWTRFYNGVDRLARKMDVQGNTKIEKWNIDSPSKAVDVVTAVRNTWRGVFLGDF